jgi:regulator of RNase E activity RraA
MCLDCAVQRNLGLSHPDPPEAASPLDPGLSAAAGIAAGLVARLRELDSCAVSDALDSLSLTGVALGLRPLWDCPAVAGPVVTVQLRQGQRSSGSSHLGAVAVAGAAPGDVIVIAHEGRLDVAGWGGLLAVGARARGLAGVIVDGAARDVDQCRELGFPVFARSPVAITARGRVVEAATNVPIVVAGVEVRPGDLVVADGSGVVFIPTAVGSIAVQRAEAIRDRERRMAESLEDGTAITEVMAGNYEAMLRPSG